MKILVFSEDMIKNYMTEENHIVISVTSPSSVGIKLPNQESRLNTLFMVFYDLDFPIPMDNCILFNEAHAKQILKFVKLYKNKVYTILVNCEAGISRSAGIAAALSKIYNGEDSYYFKEYIPNSLVYRTILEVYHR